MAYTPGALPKEVPPYLMREFLAISEGLEQPTQVLNMSPVQVAPPKPREGDIVVAVGALNLGFGPGPYAFINGAYVPMFSTAASDGIIVACSDETSDLVTGLLRTFRLYEDVTFTEIITDVVSAPAGAAVITDVKVGGASILSTKPEVQAGEFTSLEGVEAVISTPDYVSGTKIEIYADQVGSSTAGAGLKVTLKWDPA